MSTFDPRHTTPAERRRIALGKWIARAAFVAAVCFAFVVSFPELLP